jgi:4-alpha-glucanotransferase
VATAGVHDSSTLREWWETEADQKVFEDFLGVPGLPPVYNPGAARVILRKIAGARSIFRVFQFQDLLHLSARWYATDPSSERINVPGTCNDFNWTWRLPATIDVIAGDRELLAGAHELV